MKKKSIPQLKKELTKWFNKYIRQRDEGLSCISCGRVWDKSFQAGHYLPSTYSSVRFNEDNCNAQCTGCNLWKHGNIVEYRAGLINRIGKDKVEALEEHRHDKVKWDRSELEERIEEYKRKFS